MPWLNDVDDGRQQGKIKYSMAQIMLTGMVMFASNLKSRRKIAYKLRRRMRSRVVLNWLKAKMFPHGDTIENAIRKCGFRSLEQVKLFCAQRLIRMRAMEIFRLLNRYYMIAIDGSGIISTHKRHCKYCLYKMERKSGKTLYYYHSIVDAALVTKAGFVISLISDFLENEDPHSSKQDCEQNAFKRIAKRLKDAFPRLPICLLLDALTIGEPFCSKYANKTAGSSSLCLRIT